MRLKSSVSAIFRIFSSVCVFLISIEPANRLTNETAPVVVGKNRRTLSSEDCAQIREGDRFERQELTFKALKENTLSFTRTHQPALLTVRQL